MKNGQSHFALADRDRDSQCRMTPDRRRVIIYNGISSSFLVACGESATITWKDLVDHVAALDIMPWAPVMRKMPVIMAFMKSSTDHDRFNFAHPYYQACP